MTPTEVLTGQAMPTDLALFDRWIFWINAGGRGQRGASIHKMGPRGEMLELASGLAQPVGLAIDAQHVYFATIGNSSHLRFNSSVCAVPISGGPVKVLASSEVPPSSIAIDNDFVYFTTLGGSRSGTVSRVPKHGGAVKIIASGQGNPRQVEVDREAIFWFEDGTWESGPILHEHRTTGEPVLVVSVPPPSVEEKESYPLNRFMVRDRDVLFVSRGRLVSIARGGSGLSRPRNLDGIRQLGAYDQSFAIDLFAVKESGLLVRYNESTATETPLARVPWPGGLAVDNTYVYVTDIVGGRILRVPKVNVAASAPNAHPVRVQ